MSKRIAISFLVLVFLSAGGWVLAQQGHPEANEAAGDIGRFSVSPVGNNAAVLLDTTTGKTWVCYPNAAGSGWRPIDRQ